MTIINNEFTHVNLTRTYRFVIVDGNTINLTFVMFVVTVYMCVCDMCSPNVTKKCISYLVACVMDPAFALYIVY